MADSSEHGLENKASELNKNASAQGPDNEFSTPISSHESDSVLAAIKPKRLKMDKDDDGAPSTSEITPEHHKGEQHNMTGAEGRDSIVSFDSSAEAAPRKSAGKHKSTTSISQTSSQGQDLSMVDMKTSWDGSAASGGSTKAGMLADPVKIAKEREKEERVRQARLRLKEERQKKLQELKEQQRIAQENREKQLEMRRKKIEDMRRRDFERRAAVEERRKMKEDNERVRRESILQRAEERVARFEAWKAGGRKGLETIREGRRSFIGTITSTPTAAISTQQQRSPNVSAVGTSLNRASLSASMPSPIKLRENKPPRKQRPASVASSMPSFVGGEPAKSPRSKSTDRTGRDRSKARPPKTDEKAVKDKDNLTEKAHMEENEKDKDGDKDGARDRSHKKEKKERVSLSFFDRLSLPKFSKKDPEHSTKETPPKKEGPIIRVQFAGDHDQDGVVEPERTLREKASSSHTKEPGSKHATSKDIRHSPASVSATRSVSPGRKETEKPADKMSLGQKGAEKSGVTAPRITPPPSNTSTPTHGPAIPASSVASVGNSASTNASQALVTSLADDGTTTSRSGGSAQDITAEEYKARLAEKRRQARERAEKEAEEDRKRQEEARLAEEERQRQEEEADRQFEEESLHLAEKARRDEQERLEKAIEAEEKRKREEAEKLEQERKMKEEAEKKAKEEADKLEKEKQERARKEEEERIQRKKKLEMIMKRVKSDVTPEMVLKVESPTKSLSSSPNISQLNSSQNSPEEHEKPLAPNANSDEEGTEAPVAEGSVVELYSDSMTSSFIQDKEETDITSNSLSSSMPNRSVTPGNMLDEQPLHDETHDLSSEAKSKFKSPLLQQLVENQGSGPSSGGPKFKSALLQNLLGKTKVGARIGLSSSTGDLVNKDTTASMTHVGNVMNTSMTLSASTADNGDISKERNKQGEDDEDKDEDTSVHESSESGLGPESFEHHTVTNGIGKDSGDGHNLTSISKSSLDSSPLEATKLPISMMNDSALGSSIEPHGDGMMSQSIVFNGHGNHKSHGMEDSSISLYSIGEGVTNSASVTGTVLESDQTSLSQGDQQLEEFIDLIDTNGKSNSLVTGLPIIAFEENNRRSDVTEYLS